MTEFLYQFGVNLSVLFTSLTVIWFAFFRPYLSEKAKNLATKTDIGEITDIVESVKSNYSQVIEEVRHSNALMLKSIDREQAIKKEIYFDAIDALFVLGKSIVDYSYPNNASKQLSQKVTEQNRKIAKVYLVGTEETISNVSAYTRVFAKGISSTFEDRRRAGNLEKDSSKKLEKANELNDKKNDLAKKLQDLKKEGASDAETIKTIEHNLEVATGHVNSRFEEVRSLLKEKTEIQLNLIRKCKEISIELSELMPSIINSFRNELSLPIPEESLQEIFKKSISNSKEIFEEIASSAEKEIQKLIS